MPRLPPAATHPQGTGGKYHQPGKSEALKPGSMLGNLLNVVPELKSFASMHLKVAFNLDSSNVGPKHWVQVGWGDRLRPRGTGIHQLHVRHTSCCCYAAPDRLSLCRAAAGAPAGCPPR